MRAIHQLLPAAWLRDAVTDQAFAWRDLLLRWGYASEIVAEHVHPELRGVVRPLDRSTRRLLKHGSVVLHYAGWSATIEAALRANGPLGLCYHNITPGELLRDFNPATAEVCDRGRAELAVFRGRIDALITPSSYNAAELRDAGIGDATVVPLLLNIPNGVCRREPSSEPVVVTVGRIAPNKRLEDVIKGFTLFQRHRAPAASLVIVGSDAGFEGYRRALDVLVARLGARNVVFTGPVAAETRDAWYDRADAYLSMSVHEGFCAPLIEALARGVPVVARGAGAVPETLDGAGIVVDGADFPLVAEALHEVTSSHRTRNALYDAAERRLTELRPDALVPKVRAALGPLLDGARPTG